MTEKPYPDHWDDALRRCVAAVRTVSALARGMGVSRSVIYTWSRIPGDLVVKAEAATGIPREELRPDLYRDQPQAAGAQS